ncbi:MAG: hypothetical protein ACYTGG_07875 [Planctomycetota bacterium]|jgi:F0F1-type ATP synthase assembly protein I
MQPDRQEAAEIRIGWRMCALGMEITAQVVAGFLLGWVYDYFWGSGSTGRAVGAIIGIAVGLWFLVSGALKLNRELDRVAPTRGRGRPLPPDDDDNNDGDDDDWTTPDTTRKGA